MSDYKILLGTKLDTSDIKKQIESVDNKYKVDLGIKLKTSEIREQISKFNGNANNIKVRLGVKLDTSDIKKQIGKIGDLNIGNGKGVAIPINTESLERSLKDVKEIVESVRKSFGSIDDESGLKSLLSSVNQISNALDRATDESNGLIKSLNELSKKDFNFNLGLDVGKKNNNMIAYGRAARKQVIPELEKQAAELEKILGGQQAVVGKFAKHQNIGFDVYSDFDNFNSDSVIRKMEALEKYINSMKKLAAMDNIKLDGFNEIHRDATELINDIAGVENAVNKAEDIPQKLKGIFGSGIDTGKLDSQLDSIVVDLTEIKSVLQNFSSNFSIDKITQSFNKLSESIEKIIKNANNAKTALKNGIGDTGSSGNNSSLEKTENELKKIKDLARQIGQLDFNIKKFIDSGDINQVREFERQLELVKRQFNETANSLNSKDIKFGSEITEEFVRARNKMAELDAKISDTKARLANDIELKLDSGKFESQVVKIESDAKNLTNTYSRVESGIREVNSALNDMRYTANKGDIEGLINANERYEKALKSVENQIKKNKITERDIASSAKLDDDRNAFMNNIDAYLKKHSAAVEKYGDKLLELKAKAESCDRVQLDHLKGQFKQLDKAIESAGKKTQTFGDRLRTQFQRYSAYLSIYEVFMYATMALKDMFEQVKAIDSAMTELKKVTDETDASYNQFLKDASSRAKEIKTTIDGLVSSTADFARLGYNFIDAQGLAEVANIYAVVGDEVNGVEGATESLISTMAAFKDEADNINNTDFAMSVIDKFNEIGNNFSISSGGIGEALKRSASALDAANATIDESIALITASNQVVQDPAAVGTAWKTISMRIRGAKTEMSELGLDTEGMVESTAKLRQEILALSGVDIMQDANTFKSPYKIMDELAEKWKHLTDIQQAKCLPVYIEICS